MLHRLAALFPLCLLLSLTACATDPNAPGAQTPQSNRFEMTHPGMGTTFRVVVFCPDQKARTQAEDVVIRVIARLEEAFDDQRPSSELYQVHANAGLGAIRVSGDFFSLLRDVQKISERSKGSLDITTGAFAQLWSSAIDKGNMPTEEELDAADKASGAAKLKLDAIARTVHLTEPGMRLDFRDIAIAYGCDAIVVSLKNSGLRSSLAQAGQMIAVGSAPPGKQGWKIQIDDAVPNVSPRSVTITDKAIVSSGKVGDGVDSGGKAFALFIDPRTGIGAANTVPVTVVARRCWQATCLARAAAVLGETDGRKFVKSNPGTAAWFHDPILVPTTTQPATTRPAAK